MCKLECRPDGVDWLQWSWKVLIPSGSRWSVVCRPEGARDRVRGPRIDGQPASRECHRHGAIQELRESLGPW